MALVARLLLFALVGACLVGLAQPPVPSNDGAPPGLPPRSWACYPTCILPQSIVAADLDADGWLDLALACATGTVWTYHNNDANGVFLPPPWAAFALPPSPSKLAVGQFRAGVPIFGFDGFLDIAVLDGLSGALNGISGAAIPAGPWAFPPAAIGPGADVASGNLNNDSLTDLVVADGVNLTIFLSPGYGPPLVIPLPGAGQVAIADFDGNGWGDIAVSVGSAVLVYLNTAPVTGVPGFAPPLGPVGPVLYDNPPTDMAVGDFNADGLPDLVVIGNAQITNLTQGFAEVLLNNVSIGGSAAFVAAPFVSQGPMSTWGFHAIDVEVLDADRNGRDDFAVANKGSDTVTVFLTDAIRLAQDNRPWDQDWCLCKDQLTEDLLLIKFKLFKIELQCGHFPISLTSGDFDHNGKIDLAVALESATEKLDAQKPSCIEIDFDIACGFDERNLPQRFHPNLTPSPAGMGESQVCPICGECPPATSEPKKG